MNSLDKVNLNPDFPHPDGLEVVSREPSTKLTLAEQVAIRQANAISPSISYVFFRRFSGNRSSQAIAYIIDNANEKLSTRELANIHHNLWLNGTVPLLYVSGKTSVDILSCMSKPSVTNTDDWRYEPSVKLKTVSQISDSLEEREARRFSAYRLADGTFWEDDANRSLINIDKAAHKTLIDKIKAADRALDGEHNRTARRVLLLTLLVKYLEDRNVFPGGWFSQFSSGANTFLDVLRTASVDTIRTLFRNLEEKFNGDIFTLPETDELTEDTIRSIVQLITKDTDTKNQIYLWNIYSFEFIPVEVLSHIYQHFTEANKGAFFTPPLLVNLMLDQVMPFDMLTGNETVFDPTCGSGVFLVSAFRRLISVWRSNHDWGKPTPEVLKTLLRDTIFGVELQETAVHVTSFSLALAICDALLPEIIWAELRFDKLINANLFAGDFAEAGLRAKQKLADSNKMGFDIIIGNPPFLSQLTPPMRASLGRGEEIPDKQTAYYVLRQCALTFLSPNGRLCMIQPAGLFYNKSTMRFRKLLFSERQLDTVLDFVSIRGLFEGADTKIVAVTVESRKPEKTHSIDHWTFRRTLAAKNSIYFELDTYDYHHVSQESLESRDWVWRVNLLGGGRLYFIIQRLSEFPTFKDFINDKQRKLGWGYGEGFIAAINGRREPASHLTGKKYLPSDALVRDGLYDENKITTVLAEKFRSAYTKKRYSGPIIMIRKTLDLQTLFREEGFLAYTSKIIGISAGPEQRDSLYAFYNQIIQGKKYLRACLPIFDYQVLSGKATSPIKSGIDRLPWPRGGNWDMAPWEDEIIEDINEYMVDYVRLGETSPLLKETADKNAIDIYCATFLRLMKKSFPDMNPGGYGCSDGLIYQAFSFNGKNEITWLNGNWVDHLRSTIYSQQGSLRTVRIVHMYEENTVIIIKPDRLRYWIRSTAIKDVDSTIQDILHAGNTKND